MAFKVGLALGGGAARGLAHLGVIKTLENAGIPLDIITGTSIGAIISAIYAENSDINETIDLVSNYLSSTGFNQTRLDFIRKSNQETEGYFGQLKKLVKTGFFVAISMNKSSFISEEILKSNLQNLIPDKNIEECIKILGLTAMDLKTGQEIVFRQGKLIDKVIASCAIPGIFPPIFNGDRILIDGSWVNPIPVKTAQELGADFVIASNVSPKMSQDDRGLTGWNISLRAGEGSRLALTNYNLELADFAISVDLMDLHWADFSKVNECINAGEKATVSLIPRLKKKIFLKRLKSSLSIFK